MISTLRNDAGEDVSVVRKHPLNGKQKPGRKVGEVDPLVMSAQILDLIDEGSIHTHPEPIKKYKNRLTFDEQVELTLRFQTFGDIDARNILITRNKGLVYAIAHQFTSSNSKFDDLVNAGNMGIIRAAELFDPGRGIKFSTFAVYWINAKIRRFIQIQRKTDHQKINGEQVRIFELDAPVPHSEDGEATLGECVASNDDTHRSVERAAEISYVRKLAAQVMEEMNDPRVNKIFEHRLLADEPEPLSQVAAKTNLSGEGVRLIENKILKRLRQLAGK